MAVEVTKYEAMSERLLHDLSSSCQIALAAMSNKLEVFQKEVLAERDQLQAALAVVTQRCVSAEKLVAETTDKLCQIKEVLELGTTVSATASARMSSELGKHVATETVALQQRIEAVKHDMNIEAQITQSQRQTIAKLRECLSEIESLAKHGVSNVAAKIKELCTTARNEGLL